MTTPSPSDGATLAAPMPPFFFTGKFMGEDAVSSIYDVNAPLLIGNGHFPIIVGPGTKAPHRYIPSECRYKLQVGWPTLNEPILTPQPNANIGVRCGKGFVALDLDDDEAALKISAEFPDSPVNKVGQRGWTAFYRADFAVPSEDVHDSDGNLVCQILSDGRQTVIPPSIHPDTKQPYRYTNGRSLQDTTLSELPLLPRDYRERIMALGYVFQKPKSQSEEEPRTVGANGFGDNPFAEINALALENRAAWVPALGLYKCKRNPGRDGPYTAVATWRASTQGHALEDRQPNLKIHRTGIKDHGNGQTYSALDLVMAARGCTLSEAFEWLEERLLPKPEVEVDWGKIVEDKRPGSAGEEETKVPPPEGEYPEMEADDEALGTFWFVGDSLPEPKPMLVPYFLPAEPCLGYVGAQTGSVKTFTAGDAAVALASCRKFAGQQVSRPGLVAIFEMEGSSRIRLKAAVQYRGIEGALPIAHSQKMPPFILRDKRISKEWTDWCKRLVRKVKWMCRQWHLPLSAIIFDPLAMFSGITDIGNFAENTLVSKAPINLANEAGCLVIVVDHYGKDTTRGLIGSIARESLAYFVLSPGDKLDGNFSKPRQLIVRKMRDGVTNVCVDYRVHVWDTQTKKIVPADDFDIPFEDQMKRTLVIEWGDQVRQHSAAEDGASEDHLTGNQRVVLNKVNELLNTEGVQPPPECGAPRGLLGIKENRLTASLRRQGISQRSYAKIKGDLLAEGLIQIAEGWLWIPLPEVDAEGE